MLAAKSARLAVPAASRRRLTILNFKDRDDLASTSKPNALFPKAKTTANPRATEPLFPPSEETLEGSERFKRVAERLQARWELVEDKRTTIALSVGALAGVWLSGTIFSTINRVPIIPDFLTFVGLVYSANFFWKYVLFKTGRDQLRVNVDDLYKDVRSKFDGEGQGGATVSVYDEEDPTPQVLPPRPGPAPSKKSGGISSFDN